MKELFSNAHVRVEYDGETRIVWMIRSALPLSGAAELVATHDAIPRVLDTLGREGKALLVDTRLAPPRNDPEFEDALRSLRFRITRGFLRVAVLTRTVVGQLQVQRQGRQAGEETPVFASEGECVSYLLGAPESKRVTPESKRPPSESKRPPSESKRPPPRSGR